MFEKRHLRVTVVHSTPAALAHADAAWIASGTAVLEAALLGVPSVVFYRMSRFEMGVARRLYRGRYFALPNLVAGREIVPELTEGDARVEPLVAGGERVTPVQKSWIKQYAGLRAPLTPIAKGGQWFGYFNTLPDADGVIRHAARGKGINDSKQGDRREHRACPGSARTYRAWRNTSTLQLHHTSALDTDHRGRMNCQPDALPTHISRSTPATW